MTKLGASRQAPIKEGKGSKPTFWCGLHQQYHHAIVKPCYFGVDEPRSFLDE